MKVLSKEFEHIQEESYLMDCNKYEVAFSFYESISSKEETSTSKIEIYSETEDEY